MRTLLFLFVLPLTLLAQNAYEQPPVLSAGAILKPEFAAGEGFTVQDAVPTYAGRNGYLINTDQYGVFSADGNVMLMRRINEIRAISKLRSVSRTDEYTKALATAASSPLLLAKGLIENPVGTVSGVPKGLWKFMNRAGQGIKEQSDRRERNPYEDSSAQQLIGFSKAKRDMALQLGVDPYSSNEVLQRELNAVTWAAFAGKMTVSVATIPVGGAAGIALTASGVSDTFAQAIRDQSPTDLRLASLKRLLDMGCSKTVAEAFLSNTAFSPTEQTAMVLHLASLKGVSNRTSFVQLASDLSASEGDAIFFTQTSRLLSELHQNGRKLARLDVLGSLPVALGADESLIVALEWDYATWTENAARFVERLKSASFGKKTPKSWVIAISGDASPAVQQNLQQAGITLATRVAPGPLK